jgi:hypothetical protein
MFVAIFTEIIEDVGSEISVVWTNNLLLIIAHEYVQPIKVCGRIRTSRPTRCFIKISFQYNIFLLETAISLSRYNDQAMAWTDEDSEFHSWQRKYIFLFSATSRPTIRPTQLPVQWVLGCFSRDNVARAWSWPLTSIWFRGKRCCSYTSTPLYVFMAWSSIN